MENLSDNEELKINSPKNSSFIRNVIISVFFLIIFIILSYVFLFTAPDNFPDHAVLSVDKGETLKDISQDLKNKKVIRSKVLFEAFVDIYGGENHIAEGDYLFENKLPVFEVARRIARKDRHLAPIKITIPEGYDILQIRDLVSTKLKNFNAYDFLKQTENKEGYLFPDTYFFFTTDNEQDVVKYMSDNFNKKIKPILPSIMASGKTEKEIITMASIIEREAKGDNDRGIISGILWNRINKGMPLQVDAAPDTYKTKGLPENPICNPGVEAIKAAINPVASNYLYYLHDKNGMIHYASTFAEHKKNKKLYLK
ncbi:MAG: endolytic transglycosylase MltG [bacterium]